MSGYTIVSLCQDTQLCLGLFCCSNIFHFFSFFKAFLFYFLFSIIDIFPRIIEIFPRCLPQKITSRYTIVWFVWRVHYCVLLLPEVMIFWFFPIISFTFSFAKVFSFNYLIPFLVSFIWNSQKCTVSQNIWCLIKTQLKHITQTIFQGGSPWATLIHNSVVCLRVHYCVLLLPEVMIFLFFSIISFTFSFAKVFSFNYLITFLLSFIWNSQKCPVSQNIWCLIKTQLKHITQTIFQGGSPWATLIHNSVVCLRVHYCVLLLPEVMIFVFFNHFLYLFLC